MPIIVALKALSNCCVLYEPFADFDLAVDDEPLFDDSVCGCCARCFEDERSIALFGVDSVFSSRDFHNLQLWVKALVCLVKLRNCLYLVIGVYTLDPHSMYEDGESFPLDSRCARN